MHLPDIDLTRIRALGAGGQRDGFEQFICEAISAPTVLAGIGIATHQATSWPTTGTRLSPDELVRLLEPVRFEREARYWNGVAASASGTLNFGGGAKDSGGRVADAILSPDTDHGRRIRGWLQRGARRRPNGSQDTAMDSDAHVGGAVQPTLSRPAHPRSTRDRRTK
ncbi:hypothetical protein OHB56_27355 [Streptomyces sp. NBC_01635]|uniref:hypothetical protein n=1 Tax=Streptomyces sp. NBC_01635 TaxID=2975904 RepID=UPI00386813FA|nr:hypothetical protein OHB56_27355 [Streptomyces sp. NBC_01635]